MCGVKKRHQKKCGGRPANLGALVDVKRNAGSLTVDNFTVCL